MAGLRAIGKDAFGPRIGLQQSEPDDHGLELLLGEVARAIDLQDLRSALRLADRARRIASKNPACLLLYVRLLIRAGFAAQALDYLKDGDGPDIVLARGLAFLELGLRADAYECCSDLLRRFSVSAVEGLWLFASRLCEAPGSDYSQGWVGVDDSLDLVGAVRRGSRIDVECSEGSHSALKFEDRQEELVSFTCSLSTENSGPIQVKADDCELLGSGFMWPPVFKPLAWVAAEGDMLLGEAQLGWSPKLRINLEISNSGGSPTRTIATTPDANSSSCFFSTVLLPLESAASRLDVALVLPEGKRISPVGSPLFPDRTPALLQDWSPPSANLSPVAGSPNLSKSAGIVDIIVPVYAGQQETLDCLRSVLSTVDRGRAEVVVVNDSSPDSQLCAALTSLAAENQITLIINSCNLGFAGSVNRGMRLHPDRDIILLNSDTQVFGDWIERLTRAAFTFPDIGTVTPLGENGSITDYSRRNTFANTSAEEIDRIASKANSGRVIDIPVGVGFCMYIKRKCLDQTGEFDAITFGKGYGEENDFCLRARNLGWRHVAATDVFIEHHGGRSFGETAKLYRKRNSRVLNALYPDYTALLEKFSIADPLLEARRAIDITRLSALASNPVLIVTHDLSGGVKRHIGRRQMELSAAGHTVIVLQRSASRDPSLRVSLTVMSLELGSLMFNLPKDLELLEHLLRDLRLAHVELHHFLGLTPAILQIATRLRSPYDIYIHDYAWICPRVNLIDGTGKYCGEPRLADCEQCIQINGSAMEESITVAELRERSAKLLQLARKVVVPSTDSRERLAKYFPEQTFETTPWESVEISRPQSPLTSVGRVRVAVIGAIGIPKGYEVLLECARDAAARDLSLDFVVIGYTVDDQPLLDTGRVFITGPYEEEEVDALLEREDCSVAFFPSVTPETWCYSLTYAIKRDLPIIAFDIGAQAERLRSYPVAELLPLSLNAQQVNFALVNWTRTLATPSEDQEGKLDQFQVAKQDSGVDGSQELVSSVQFLKLPEGIYAFTVRDGGSLRDGSETLALPGLQVGIAPARSPGKVEFLTGPSVVERWLAYRTDLVVFRISGGDGSLLLTSLQKHDSDSLAVNLERLDVQSSSFATQDKAVQALEHPVSESLDVRLMAHIRFVGDMDFAAGWAGWAGQRLWIEGFAVLAVGELPPNCLEYRGLAANGHQTPWLSSQALCGSRGGGLPLLGYAIRMKPTWAERYTCTYNGSFFSGAKVGHVENGALCSSDLPGDPLEAIELRIRERQLQTTTTRDRGSLSAFG